MLTSLRAFRIPRSIAHGESCEGSRCPRRRTISLVRDRDVWSSEAMRQRYDEFAEWYDTYVTSGAGQPFARSADRLLGRLLGPGEGRLCLDLGCGGGAHVPALAGLGWRVTGVDISPPPVDLARPAGITATGRH